MEAKCCRFCGNKLKNTFVDLGMSPLSNLYLWENQLSNKENYYPLHLYVCSKCLLVQLEEFESPKEIFSEYAYFSSYSNSWLDHAKKYSEMIIDKLQLDTNSTVIEIASNDGYLLQNFIKRNIPVVGIEPAMNIAKEAVEKGIPTIAEFFGVKLAKDLKEKGIVADLLIGNNVLAHVPDINDFVSGMKEILKSDGTITMEFPHILKLIMEKQFDTIYHEHFSYFSLISVIKIFKNHDLDIYDVEELNTHGGSLRIYATHSSNKKLKTEALKKVIDDEVSNRLNRVEFYEEFSEDVKKIKRDILKFLIKIKDENKVIVAYGAPAKGNTLLNFCGIGKDFIEYTVDKNPYKQQLYLPGSHIPIFYPDKIKETKPDYIIILPWNIKTEILEQLNYVKEWGGKLVTLIPTIEIY